MLKLQQLGGWQTLAVVKRYAHVNSETYLESINAMPSLQNWADSGQKIPQMRKPI